MPSGVLGAVDVHDRIGVAVSHAQTLQVRHLLHVLGVADRVQLSREALRDWQNETRGMMREISRMVATVPA